VLRLGLFLESIEIVGTRASIELEALIDTGAEGNYVRGNARTKKRFEGLGYHFFKETDVSMPRRRKPKVYVQYTFSELRFLGQILLYPEFILMNDIDYDAIIGVEVMQIMGLDIDMWTHKLTY
jgi:predicted aspartyl protease